jgi:DNA repair photolyase
MINSLHPGRGATHNPPNRFEPLTVEIGPDWTPEDSPAPRTKFYRELTNSFLNKNDSPDIPFTWSANPYRGCEHGCAYCYARPTHEYFGLSAGLDFETKIFVKLAAPRLLREEIGRPGWQPEGIAFSGVTDCYQPAERHFKLTRQCLEILAEARHPVSIVTKSALVTRDIDVLSELAAHQATRVYLSVTTLDSELAGQLEPRASRPSARLDAIARLHAAGIPVGVMVAPIIPGLNDTEIPAILKAAREAGAESAGWVMLRLPHAVKDVMSAWLEAHVPLQKAKTLALVRDVRGGALNQTNWGQRMRGEGPYAEQIAEQFRIHSWRLGYQTDRHPLNASAFRRPSGAQMELFAS